MVEADPRPPRTKTRLSDFILTRRPEILEAWEREVRSLPIARDLERPTLIDHIPDVLDRIAAIAKDLSFGRIPQLPEDVAEVHAMERLDEGFDLAQVVAEFSILRDCITRLWEEHIEGAHVRDLRVLHQAIDRAVAASVDRYTQARDRTIVALDRIATAALESRSLDELLQRLLRVLVETTAAVDTAAILLVDGDRLRVRASVGLDEDLERAVSVGLGEGFSGRIAVEGRPHTIHAAATDPLVASPSMRLKGVRALYGLPLVENGVVIGVAHMGSLTAHDFSKQDKRLFAALANRATLAIYQHMLREKAQRTAAQLREREQQLQTLANNVPLLMWMADATGHVFWFNDRWRQYTGMSETDHGHSDALAFNHPDHVARVTETFRHAIDTGEPWEDIFPLRGKDGQYRWFLTRAIPIRDPEGRVVQWFGTNTDVTEQRFLAEATNVLSSSLNYQDTLERVARLAVPELADWCVVDILEGRESLRRIAVAHRDPRKIEFARAWAEKYPPDLNDAHGIGAVVRTGQPEFAPVITPEALEMVARDEEHLGMIRALGLSSGISVPLSSRGQRIGAITLVMSESGRRFARSDFEIAQELARRAGIAIDNARLYLEAQQAVRHREEILAIVSHDLRNPLGAIDLGASMLLQIHGKEPRSRKQLDVIRRSASRMEHMISDLLDTASIQAGRLALERREERVDSVMDEVFDTHAPLAAEQQIDLVRDDHIDDVVVCCDRGRILQVFGNLIGNAIKFCAAGATITVRGTSDGRQVRFEVHDTGPGIAPEELPHVFEPYWSAKRHARHGTGLGLYICKGIIDAHGGTIWVESEPARGTSLIFTLPIAGAPG